jgi:hypothetical protein
MPLGTVFNDRSPFRAKVEIEMFTGHAVVGRMIMQAVVVGTAKLHLDLGSILWYEVLNLSEMW